MTTPPSSFSFSTSYTGCRTPGRGEGPHATWNYVPNASKIRQKLQTSGMNVTLGDFAFAAIALAVCW